jgi:hypothetical protein
VRELQGCPSGHPFFMRLNWDGTRVCPLVNLVRMYAYRNGVTNVFDIPKGEARDKRRELAREGWVIYHSVLV